MLVYFGRQRPVDGIDLAADEFTVVEPSFKRRLARASALVVLDPSSFPWEARGQDIRDCPLYVVFPSGFSAEELWTVFKPAIRQLTFFDRAIFPDSQLAQAIAARARFASCQWTTIAGSETALEWIRKDLAHRDAPPMTELFRRNELDAISYWRKRGDLSSSRTPEKSVCSIRHSLRANKLIHLEQMAALRPTMERFAPDREGWAFIEFGCGVGRVMTEAAQLGAALTGLDASTGMVAVCKANHKNATVVVSDAGDPLPVRDGSQDVAAFVTVFHHLDDESKRRAVRAAFRCLRPGGRLVFLEDFVASTCSADPITLPLSWSKFCRLILDLTKGAVVLEHFETVPYSHVAQLRTAIVVFTKIHHLAMHEEAD
jgi:SAM-dependent methyltransferase